MQQGPEANIPQDSSQRNAKEGGEAGKRRDQGEPQEMTGVEKERMQTQERGSDVCAKRQPQLTKKAVRVKCATTPGSGHDRQDAQTNTVRRKELHE